MKIKIDELKAQATEVILKAGKVKKEDVEKILEVLLFADASGNGTQGVIKLTGDTPLQDVQSEGAIEVLKETPISAHLDAHGNPAPLAAYFATEKAIEKCRASGIGIVGVKGTYSSNGAQGFYANKIAQEGFVAIVASRSPGAVAPYGGKEPIFGTNPIGYGFPTLGDPLLFDMASSAITWYGLVKAKAEGKEIPGDVAIDSNGVLTTNPAEAMEGAILPFDRSYKGAGIAMVVELLGGPLVGASFCNIGSKTQDWGTFILAIDPGLFGSREAFKAAASELIKVARGSKPRTDSGTVILPGDKSVALRREALATGMVEVSDAILEKLKGLL